MKRLTVLLCALYLALAFGTVLAASSNKVRNTLDDIPPAWSQTLQCDTTGCPRFEPVMGGAAVLDRETGLVWEQSPSRQTYQWWEAVHHCNTLNVGNRMGWRVPTIQEQASLMDPSVPPPGPTLPGGHPFSNVQSLSYWSATTTTLVDPGAVWFAALFNAGVGKVFPTTTQVLCVWCVRGGQGVDSQ
jgi:hypothetical protein